MNVSLDGEIFLGAHAQTHNVKEVDATLVLNLTSVTFYYTRVLQYTAVIPQTDVGTVPFGSDKELHVDPVNTATISVMDEFIVSTHNYCVPLIPRADFRLRFLRMGQSDVRAGG